MEEGKGQKAATLTNKERSIVQMTGKSLQETLDRLENRVREKRESKVMQLPLWSGSKRGTPNSFMRSALFSAIQSKDRKWLEDEILYSQKGITVKFTGKQLNQEDLTLWETLVHMARDHPLGAECTFTAHSILKALDLSTGGKEHKRLHSGIIRLTACAVQVTHEGKTYFGSLIEGGIKDEITGYYNIELNKKLIRLYGETQWTAIDWEQRLILRGKPLAQALHAFYSSHCEPFPVKLETLRQITGSRNKRISGFKRLLKAALDELVKIGFLVGYEIDGDIVKVQRMKVEALSYGG